MDFILSKYGLLSMTINDILEGIETEEEAIALAHETALHTKEGWLVALFSRDGEPIIGWKVLKDKKLRQEPLDVLKNTISISQGSYEFIKSESDKRRKAHKKNKQ